MIPIPSTAQWVMLAVVLSVTHLLHVGEVLGRHVVLHT